MKNKRKFIVTLLIVSLAALLLTGCGKKEVTPEESGEIFYNIAAHQDASKLKEVLGNNSSEFEDMMDDEVSEAKDAIKDMISTSDLNLSEDETNNLIDSFVTAMNNLQCKNVNVDYEYSDKDTVDLKFDVTYVDIDTLSHDITNELQNKYKAKILSQGYSNFDYDALQKDFVKEFFNELTTRLNNYESDGQTKSLTYTFKKKEYKGKLMSKTVIWVPESNYNFGKKVGQTCVGQ